MYLISFNLPFLFYYFCAPLTFYHSRSSNRTGIVILWLLLCPIHLLYFTSFSHPVHLHYVFNHFVQPHPFNFPSIRFSCFLFFFHDLSSVNTNSPQFISAGHLGIISQPFQDPEGLRQVCPQQSQHEAATPMGISDSLWACGEAWKHELRKGNSAPMFRNEPVDVHLPVSVPWTLRLERTSDWMKWAKSCARKHWSHLFLYILRKKSQRLALSMVRDIFRRIFTIEQPSDFFSRRWHVRRQLRWTHFYSLILVEECVVKKLLVLSRSCITGICMDFAVLHELMAAGPCIMQARLGIEQNAL